MTLSKKNRNKLAELAKAELLKELIEDLIDASVDYGANPDCLRCTHAFSVASEKVYNTLEVLDESRKSLAAL